MNSQFYIFVMPIIKSIIISQFEIHVPDSSFVQ